jgi:branched-chain amino acid transport system substrate-binding protein
VDAGTSNSVAGTAGIAGTAGTAGAASSGGAAARAGSGQAAAGAAAGANQASDVGVTPTSVTIGNVTGVTGLLGPDAFGVTLRGLQAFVAVTNAKGGVGGRKLILKPCDDAQDATQNLVCTQQLVTQAKVFVFIDNNSLSPSASAHYEYQQGVPDLGFPLDNGYAKYPNMFSLYGTPYPRDGTQVGDHGLNWQQTGIYRYFKQAVGGTKAAFFFYSVAASQSQAQNEIAGAKVEGLPDVYDSGGSQGENLAGAAWDTDVLAMQHAGADVAFDAVDVNANQKICKAIDRYNVPLKAKVSTIEVWDQDVGSPSWSQRCRNLVYITGSSDSYADTANPSVAQFRAAFDTYMKPQGFVLSQWTEDGYAGGQALVDYLTQAGPAPTRKGFIQWLDSIPPLGYTDHGFFSPVSWANHPHPQSSKDCNIFVQWQDSAGTFVTRSHGPGGYSCYVTPEVGTPYSPDGS